MEKRSPFHEQLKYERLRRGWSQEDVAEKLGGDAKTVARWESGKRLPQPYYRQKLFELFEKSADEFGLLQEANEESETAEKQASSTPDEQYGTPTLVSISTPLGTLYRRYDIHSSWVVAIAWEPCGDRIASAGGDGTVRIWKAHTGDNLLTYRGHSRLLAKVNLPPIVYTVAWSPDGRRIASAGDGAKVYVWDSATGHNLSIYHGHSGFLPNVYAIAWSPDGRYIASACNSVSTDKTIHLWDVATGQTVRRYTASCGMLPSFSVLAVAWSPDGSRIASAWDGKFIQIWDAFSDRHLLTYAARSPWINDLAWSPDSGRIAIANSDSTAQILDAATGELLLTYSGHSDSVRDVVWSPDGSSIASASNDKTVQIWDAATGDSRFKYRGHADWATALAWSPDGTRIASGSNDKTVQIWQANAVIFA